MTTRVGPKGQVVIPKHLRELASLEPGDEVDVEFQDDAIVVTAHRPPRCLGGRFAHTGMAARLLEDRGNEPR